MCVSLITIVHKGKRHHVPCGKCNYCLQANRAQWTFRLRQEMKVAESAHFLTMTYEDERLPLSPSGRPELRKKHVQDFMKRLRKDHAKTGKTIWKDTKYAHRSSKWPSLRYYFVGEYGTKTARPHYHAIMFNLHSDSLGTIADVWGKGHVQIAPATPATIHYVTKYVINRHEHAQDDYTKPFANISKGMGLTYLQHNAKWHQGNQLRNYAIQDEHKVRLPRYYKDKLFDDFQKLDIKYQTQMVQRKREKQEIERISRLHPDPLAYLTQRLHANHELVNSKVNSKDKF